MATPSTDPGVDNAYAKAQTNNSQESILLSMSSNSTGNAGSGTMSSKDNAVANPTQSPINNVYSNPKNNESVNSSSIMFTNNTKSLIGSAPLSLASPTFSVGPNTSTATKDIYTNNNNTPINNVKPITEETLNTTYPNAAKTEVDTVTNPDGTKTTVTKTTTKDKTGLIGIDKSGKPVNLLSALKGGKAKKDSFGNSILNTAKDIKGYNKDLQDFRKTASIPKLQLGIKSLPAGCGKNLTDSLNKELDKLNKTLAIFNGKITKIPTANLKCLAALGGLMNDISGISDAFSLQDSGVGIAGSSNLIMTGLAVGMSGMFGPVTNKETDKNKVNKIASKVAPTVVEKSDTKSLNDMSKKTTTGSIKVTNPTIIKDFSKSYTKKPMSDKKTTIEDHAMVMESYSTIDPNWNKDKNSSGGVIVNLSKLIGASSDFNNMLRTGIISSNDQANLLLLLAASFKSTDVNSSLSTNFSKTVINKPIINNSDPITLNNTTVSRKAVGRPKYVADMTSSTYVKNADSTTTRTITTTTGTGIVTVSTITYDINGNQIV